MPLWLLLFSLAAVGEGKRAKIENVSADLPWGTHRPPGTFLLNMLIKNEAEHLDRTLPKWAKIIDYWLIGVDDKNTDNSPEIIQKHLGHLPGEIVIVNFRGMGPTWSDIVQVGIEKYPEASHGIVSDADFMPMVSVLDRNELDFRCSKHMYTIWTQDHSNERRMDWIYRNIPGAVVKRRTHQIVEVPELPQQEVFQTLITLPLEEREGGYQDRTEGKQRRYIKFLEDDLEEYPNDTRTLYYLGYAHFDIFHKEAANNPTSEHWQALEKGVEYFKQRVSMKSEGNKEERWFALLKLGEIYERWYNDWKTSESFYRECTRDDPERADPFFYLGQHLRLRGQPDLSLKDLKIAASLTVPDRSLFQWHYLYHCLSKVEYGKALMAASPQSKSEYTNALKLMKQTKCEMGDSESKDVKKIVDFLELRVQQIAKSAKDRLSPVKNLLRFFLTNFDALEQHFTTLNSNSSDFSLFHDLTQTIEVLQRLVVKEKLEKSPDWLSCREYRRATTPYLRFAVANNNHFKSALTLALFQEWVKASTRVRQICR